MEEKLDTMRSHISDLPSKQDLVVQISEVKHF